MPPLVVYPVPHVPVHDDCPEVATYKPTPHTEHVTPLPAAALKVPAAHIVQPAEFAVVTVPLYPAAHTKQSVAASRSAAVDPLVVYPAVQEVHVTPLPAAALNVPAAHILQPVEFAALTVPLYPAAHTEQSLESSWSVDAVPLVVYPATQVPVHDVPPVVVWYVPVSHTVQATLLAMVLYVPIGHS